MSTMCDHSMCEHSMCEHPMCEHPSEHSMCVSTHHITHHKPKEENTKKKFLGRVLGPDRRNLTTSYITHHGISPDIRHHISPHHTLQAERREHREEVVGPSSWAGEAKSHHITHHT